MGVVDIYSKRHKTAPDVYTYSDIPIALRIQIVHILRDLFGHYEDYDFNGCRTTFDKIHDTLCREYGLFQLAPSHNYHADEKVIEFVVKVANAEQVLDVIEVSFRLAIYRITSNAYGYQLERKRVEAAIDELNTRFREHGIGYQYESGEMIRVDSQLIHAEVVKPTLTLLKETQYAGANEEFLKAFEHYRKGDTKECLNECLKAFESTMKSICAKRNWTFDPKSTASALVEVCMQNGLIPTWMQNHLTGVRTTLESGVPTVRNRMSGHGQGATIIDVPPHYASYMLHLTATTIKFLVESEKALK
jgi:hypothetical protein